MWFLLFLIMLIVLNLLIIFFLPLFILLILLSLIFIRSHIVNRFADTYIFLLFTLFWNNFLRFKIIISKRWSMFRWIENQIQIGIRINFLGNTNNKIRSWIDISGLRWSLQIFNIQSWLIFFNFLLLCSFLSLSFSLSFGISNINSC